MAYWDDNEYGYDLGYDGGTFDDSFLDDYSEYDYGYVPEIPDLSMNYGQYAEPEPQYNLYTEPQVQPAQYDYAPPDVLASRGGYMYGDPTQTPYVAPSDAAPQVNPVTGAITRAGTGLVDWATQNPKDVLGALTGAGLGIAGYLQKEGRVPTPDLSSLRAAQAQLQAQASKTAQYNDPVYQAAMRNLQAQLDQPRGHDPRLVQQRADERAQLQQDFQRRGQMGSELYNRALARFDTETTSLLERDAATRGGQLISQYTQAAGAASPEQTTRTFSQLSDLGLRGAQTEQAGASTNAQLQEARRNQLMTAGGNVFGRSITSDPYAELRKQLAKSGQGTLTI